MFVTILKSNRPIALVFILFTGIGLWLPSFINPIAMSIPSDTINMPLYEILISGIYYNTKLSVGIGLVCVLLQGLLLIQFNKKYIIINHRTYLPAFFYVFIVSAFVPLQRLNPVIIGVIFVYLSIYFMFAVYRNDFALNKMYVAGFFISIASLFWAPFAVLVLLPFISLIILRPFVGREWMVSLLGFLTPYLFVFVHYFVFATSNELAHFLFNVVSNLALFERFNGIHFSYYIFYGILALLVLVASFSAIRHYQMKKIKIRKFFVLNWWLFFVSFALFVLFKNVGYEVLFVVAIPLAFLLSDFFYLVKRRRILNLLILIMFLSAGYIQIIAHS